MIIVRKNNFYFSITQRIRNAIVHKLPRLDFVDIVPNNLFPTNNISSARFNSFENNVNSCLSFNDNPLTKEKAHLRSRNYLY
jgi:hypothetical protein